MIIRDGHEIGLECEHCPHTTDLHDSDDFDQMIADAKVEGWWLIPCEDGEWLHICPSCREDEQ